MAIQQADRRLQMIYPGYLLNPGDMFSVDPERVLFATGARKYNKNNPDAYEAKSQHEEIDQVVDDDAEDLLEGEEEEGAAKEEEKPKEEEKVEEIPEDPKQALKVLLSRAKQITQAPNQKISGTRKQDLRSFQQEVKRVLSKIRGTKYNSKQPIEETIEGLEETLNTILGKIATASADSPAAASSTPSTPTSSDTTSASAPTTTTSNPQMQDGREDAYNAARDARLLHAALERAQENPVDVRKPYATPWRPREFMSAFAFIPRYLEVNQNICSAVYLRHPVARPGLAEVPTPFAGETMALAFNWYLRRR